MRSVFAAALLASTCLSLGTLGSVQSAEAQTTETIRRVIVEGNQRIEDRTIQSYLLVEPGDAFDPTRIDLSLKTLFATGLFADASFEKSGPDLVVRVVENPIINRVIFEGNSAIDDDKIREEIQAAPRGIFTVARVQTDVQRILDLYQKSGRFSASVEPQYKALDQNRVDLVFVMTEGPVTGVRAINFIGNEQYSDSELRSEVVTKQSRWWRFFSSNDNYDPGRLEYDRELLRQHYQNKGFYDFRVVSAVADLTPDREDFYITYTIEEGEEYTFGEVKVETALDKLDGDALRRVVPFKDGDLFRGDAIEDTIDTLTFAAGIAGYAFVDVKPRLEADPETNKVNVTFALDEGPRVYIERINIVGNTQTLDRVIRRELRVTEGDAFNRVLLDRSRNRVRALGFFEDVTITETPGSKPDRSVVELAVKEQPTGELSFAAGFSSVDQFLIDASVAQRNLRGRGQSLSARVSASARDQVIDLRFREPKFLDRNLSASIDLFSTQTDFTDFGSFKQQRTGGGLSFGFPLSEHTNLGLRYRLQQDDIQLPDVFVIVNEDGTAVDDAGSLVISRLTEVTTNADGQEVTTVRNVTADDAGAGQVFTELCSTQNVNRALFSTCLNERTELASILGYTFNWDRRNDPIAPTGGFDFYISQDIAGLGGDVQYLRTEMSGATYRGLFKGVRASGRLSAGYIEPLGDDENVRINNRFFRGGSTFRGFDVAGLGPRNVVYIADDEGNVIDTKSRRQDAIGGKAYYQATGEITLPPFIPEQYGINMALFAEAGGVGLVDDVDKIDPVFFLTGTTPVESSTVRNGIPTTFDNHPPGTPAVFLTKDALSLRASAGLSVGWDSPFGPIRFDFSHILRKEDYDKTETFRFSTSTRF